MRNTPVFLYLTIVLAALLLFAIFDSNTKKQESNASDMTRMSRINQINSECRENLRLCGLAQESGKGAEISVRALKIFEKYAEINITFGLDAAAAWKTVTESALSEGLSNVSSDRINVPKGDVEKKAAVFTALKALIDRAIENGYNFEF